MGCFVWSRKLRLTQRPPQATGLLYYLIKQSQVLENICVTTYPAIISHFLKRTKYTVCEYMLMIYLLFFFFFRSFYYLCK